MTQQILDAISKSIEKMNSVNPVELLDSDKISSQLSKITESEFITLYRKVVDSFQIAIEKNILISVPHYYMANTGNNGDVNQILNQISNTYLNPNRSINLGGLETSLLEVQNFLLQRGLYDLYVQSPIEFNREEFEEYKSQSRRISRLLKSKEEKLKKLNDKLIEDLAKLNRTIDVKTKQLATIESELETSKSNSKSITNIKSQVESTQTEIKGIDSKLNLLNKNAEAKYNDILGQITPFRDSLKELQGDLNAKKVEIETWEKGLEGIKSQTVTINEELKKLLNPAIAKNLLVTFKNRKKWLFWTKIIWAFLAIIATYGVYSMTDNVLGTADLSKVNLEQTVSILIKLIPFIVVLYFSLRQFSRNRLLEEEYAFRESIATSLMAYAEQIKNDPMAKDELIKETVNKLYTSPLLTLNKRRTSNESDKIDKDILDKITNIIKEAKGPFTSGE